MTDERRAMLRIVVFCIGLMIALPGAWADAWKDCEQKQDADRSIRGCTEIITEGSETGQKLPSAYNNRCNAYLSKGDYDKAIADCDKAIELDPKFASAYNNRCFNRAIIGQLQQALADCNESLRLSPSDPYTLDSRGLTYLKLGEYDKAIADYDAALKIDPNYASSLYGRGPAKLKKGDTSGNVDIASAKAIKPDIAEDFVGYGVK